MPLLPMNSPSKNRSDKGALIVYLIIVLMILMATTFAGGSIAISKRSNAHTPPPSKVNLRSITNQVVR